MPEIVELFDPGFDWSTVLPESDHFVGESAARKIFTESLEILTCFGKEGIQKANGEVYAPESYLAHQSAVETHMRKFAAEQGGFHTPDMTALFFDTGPKYDPTKAYTPDTSYTDWCVQRKMKLELEDRREWDADILFVLMKEHGQVRYGTLTAEERSMRNYEWGAGIQFWRTWFETNQFGIKMAALAPKFRYQYFQQMAVAIYGAFAAAAIPSINFVSQNVVRDLNLAMTELMRWTNGFGHTPFANASFRIITAPENMWFLNAARAMSMQLSYDRMVLDRRMNLTETPLLTATDPVYVIVDKWEQNELGTRVPFGVFGKATDIDTFADKTTYRGAYGFNLDVHSVREITWDTSDCHFGVTGPLPMKMVEQCSDESG